MADGFIVRKGGVTTEQALAPTITEVSTTATSITFTITNNDASTAVILYEVDDATPDANSIELAAAATSGNLTISGLSPGTVDLYATANVTGKVKSNVTEKEFTLVDPFTAATGGTTLEYNSGGKRFRSHTFTSDGNFVVSNVGTTSDDRNTVDLLLVAGGASGSMGFGAGGGAGGFRQLTKQSITVQSFSINVGAGGTAPSNIVPGNDGTNSSALGSLSSGGGGAGSHNTNNARAGGSGGGGGGQSNPGGAGNIGSFNPSEGNNGGNGADFTRAGGGGGAGAVGGNATQNGTSGNGGNGLANNFRTGSNETRAGGGGGGGDDGNFGKNNPGTGGSGGGGNGSFNTTGISGTTNTGSGGGGGGRLGGTTFPGGNGGSGIVVIRYEIETV